MHQSLLQDIHQKSTLVSHILGETNQTQYCALLEMLHAMNSQSQPRRDLNCPAISVMIVISTFQLRAPLLLQSPFYKEFRAQCQTRAETHLTFNGC